MATGPYPTPYIPVPDLDLSRSLSEGMRTGLAQAGREDELARRREEMTEGRRQFDLNLALQRDQYEKMRAIAEAQKEYEKLQYLEAIKARDEARKQWEAVNPLIGTDQFVKGFGREFPGADLTNMLRAQEETPGMIRAPIAHATLKMLEQREYHKMYRSAFTEAQRKQKLADRASEIEKAIMQKAGEIEGELAEKITPYEPILSEEEKAKALPVHRKKGREPLPFDWTDILKVGRPDWKVKADYAAMNLVKPYVMPEWEHPREEAMKGVQSRLDAVKKSNSMTIRGLTPKLMDLAKLIEQQGAEAMYTPGTQALLSEWPEAFDRIATQAGAAGDRQLAAALARLRRLGGAANLEFNQKAEATVAGAKLKELATMKQELLQAIVDPRTSEEDRIRWQAQYDNLPSY